MLVDNAIDGDSRVQKAAKSLAGPDWDVHLLGIAPGKVGDEYTLGSAKVRRIPLGKKFPDNSLRRRLKRLRFPLAYKDGSRAAQKEALIRAKIVDAMAGPGRELPSDLAGEGFWNALAEAAPLRHRLRSAWIGHRVEKTREARRWARRREDGRLERLEADLWSKVPGIKVWRRLDKTPLRFESAFLEHIVSLNPDIIHAHDFRMVGIAVRARDLLRRAGRDPKVLYDCHEFVPGLERYGYKWEVSQADYESRYIDRADMIVTVGEPIAECLKETHGLDYRPEIILNAPMSYDRSDPMEVPEGEAPDVRTEFAIPPEEGIVVYAGAAAQRRGLQDVVEALPELDSVHAVFLVPDPSKRFIGSLKTLAAELGVADRAHFRPYVSYDRIIQYIRTADIGVYPLWRGPVNHDLALGTKLLEYVQAELPVVVSDAKAMADFTAKHGIGEVFTAGKPKELATALRTVLGDRERYTAPYRDRGFIDRFTWEEQYPAYDKAYRALLG